MSTMSRKHFDMLAAAVRRARYQFIPQGAYADIYEQEELASPADVLDAIAKYIADVCEKANPSFDREAFLMNCDVKP